MNIIDQLKKNLPSKAFLTERTRTEIQGGHAFKLPHIDPEISLPRSSAIAAGTEERFGVPATR